MADGAMPPAAVRAIRIAVLAMGGEGGGVLAGWIEDMARHEGYLAQVTSVPGVAQRTGATIYYIELFPVAEVERVGRRPVLALMPVPGDVDIVIASELMEAARAVQRGIVTPDRTTLVLSTNRVFAMNERLAMGDGRSDDKALFDSARTAARSCVSADLALIAERTGSVISAALFGALAASAALPFGRAAFEATIERGGVGVKASKRCFAAAFAAASGEDVASAVAATAVLPPPLPVGAGLSALLQHVKDSYEGEASAVMAIGIERLIDYQDLEYARLYVERLRPVALADERSGARGKLLSETARYLALGMAYEDTIRVADLKIRGERFERVAEEVRLQEGQILQISEYLHPRLSEIAESVPAWLGRALLKKGLLRAAVTNLTQSGRTVTTTSLRGFFMLWAVSKLRPFRRSSLRFIEETGHLEAWLSLVTKTAASHLPLAIELAELRNLVKGYGDTHVSGRANYADIVRLLPAITETSDPAKTLQMLRKAALADDTGTKLSEVLTGLGLSHA
jgi:indolepyruvate ferredoxin oxidoreductase, beta subunit